MAKELNNYNPVAKIIVIGVGGGGNNSVETMINSHLDSFQIIAANTDKQVLAKFPQECVLHLGDERGIGAGANPEIGKTAAESSREEIKSRLQGADLVIITAGMGGGTGTGAAPVIAQIAKECNALVVAVVTTPFDFEGPKRMRIAKQGLQEIKKCVDSYIVISNNKLLQQYGNISFSDAFICANNVLKQTIRTIVDVIATPSIINLDFADLSTIIKNKGETVIGIGQANGQDRAVKAITSAITSPILESSVVGASDAIVNFSASQKVTLNEIQSALGAMREIVGNEINIIFGITTLESEESNKLGELFVSVIATGLRKDAPKDIDQIQDEVINVIKKDDLSYVNDETKEFFVSEGTFKTQSFFSMDNDEDSNDELADILKH
ncbi:cell division protein FtsZ [Metamycoplasma hominis]|uniref:cell division protein FtsZ n=1 Tax=Metamycoplasma hominis TaxID=2098 RepID=UPI0006401E5D|nr:cell division protein FtsZ [Metamycoplasma hominis]AKJ52511.1 cell division protein FtsZ [Metamycoplasma hominis]QKX36622.1 cell division protein FtsZ [Metamycoplasma hominis]